MKMDKQEIRRYLGIKSGEIGVDDSLLEELWSLLTIKINPRIISGEYEIERIDNGYRLSGTRVIFKGKLIDKVLKDCESIVLFAVTLTAEADSLLREYSIKSMTKAVTLNACMTAYLENFADDFEAQQKENAESEGKGITRRISCGYGDFDIAKQNDIIELLRADKYLGITVNENNMLVPVKSITALIGIGEKLYKKEEKCAHCSGCSNQCAFKKEEK
ncbi:MAG: hypothetical protein EOM87_00120 [Clostridia bacterium]|nr:hypothetical protein [Clostridia bacterium]